MVKILPKLPPSKAQDPQKLSHTYTVLIVALHLTHTVTILFVVKTLL